MTTENLTPKEKVEKLIGAFEGIQSALDSSRDVNDGTFINRMGPASGEERYAVHFSVSADKKDLPALEQLAKDIYKYSGLPLEKQDDHLSVYDASYKAGETLISINMSAALTDTVISRFEKNPNVFTAMYSEVVMKGAAEPSKEGWTKAAKEAPKKLTTLEKLKEVLASGYEQRGISVDAIKDNSDGSYTLPVREFVSRAGAESFTAEFAKAVMDRTDTAIPSKFVDTYSSHVKPVVRMGDSHGRFALSMKVSETAALAMHEMGTNALEAAFNTALCKAAESVRTACR